MAIAGESVGFDARGGSGGGTNARVERTVTIGGELGVGGILKGGGGGGRFVLLGGGGGGGTFRSRCDKGCTLVEGALGGPLTDGDGAMAAGEAVSAERAGCEARWLDELASCTPPALDDEAAGFAFKPGELERGADSQSVGRTSHESIASPASARLNLSARFLTKGKKGFLDSSPDPVVPTVRTLGGEVLFLAGENDLGLAAALRGDGKVLCRLEVGSRELVLLRNAGDVRERRLELELEPPRSSENGWDELLWCDWDC